VFCFSDDVRHKNGDLSASPFALPLFFSLHDALGLHVASVYASVSDGPRAYSAGSFVIKTRFAFFAC